ncbi:MAG: TIGR03663 family protein [Oligoflexia bacterium]|nr:TIGR03663 family protein [Oligoflexia bacterium]
MSTSERGNASYLTNREWAVFLLLVGAGLLLRWLQLDVRPIHHDESLHAMYGIYFFDWPDEKFYRYDPMLHGPMMYNLYPLVYAILGISDWSIRAPIAFLGSIFIFVPFIFRRYFSSTALLALTGAVALSPTLVYWSRLIHHDLLVLLGWILMLYGATLSREKQRALFFLCGIAVQWAVKANVYITVALLVAYLFYEVIISRVVGLAGDTCAGKLGRYVRANWAGVLFGLAAAAFIFCYFYSSGFRYTDGILDGLYRKGFSYWLDQHNKERIVGPFMFHFYVLSWYELPFIIVMAAQTLLLLSTASDRFRIAIASCLSAALLCALMSQTKPTPEFELWKLFKLKDGIDIFGLIFLVGQSLIITTYHLLRGERKLAFFGYFFYANFFAYSYAGEKTPWLSIYPFVCGLVYLTLYFDDYFAKNPIKDWRVFPLEYLIGGAGICSIFLGLLFGLLDDGMSHNLMFFVYGALLTGFALVYSWLGDSARVSLISTGFVVIGLYLLHISILTNFTYAGKPNELLSQVHTTYEYDQVVRDIRTKLLLQPEEKRDQVLVSGESVWPTVWYLRNLPLRYEATKEQKKDYKYILQDWKDNDPDLPEGFEIRKLKLRGWWVPDYTQMTVKGFFKYALLHTPWKPGWGGDPSGFSNVALLTRK